MSRLSQRERKEVKRLIADVVGKPELKYYDFPQTTYGVPSVLGGTICPNAIQEGTGPDERLGNEISCHSLTIRALFYNSINNTAPATVRLIVGIDLASAGTVPSTSAVLAPVLGGTTPTILSGHNVTTSRGRFKILKDRTFTLEPATVVASIPAGTMQMNAVAGSNRMVKWRFPLNNHKVEFAGSATTDFRIGSLFVMWIGQFAAPNEPDIDITTRLSYRDT